MGLLPNKYEQHESDEDIAEPGHDPHRHRHPVQRCEHDYAYDDQQNGENGYRSDLARALGVGEQGIRHVAKAVAV